MAAVDASLTVTFTNVYIGQHRICWTISPSTTFDCSTVVFCGTAGVNNVDIPITVDNESCDPVTYIGYVQPSCQALGSELGRVPFTVTFTPSPTCVSYRVTCETVALASAPFSNSGRGYGPNNPPTITFSGGHATATITIGSTITISNAGSLYTPGTYTNVPFQTLTGTGSGGKCTVVVGGGGTVTSVTTTVDGIDYLNGNTFGINAADVGGTGSGFLGTFSATYGRAINITLDTNLPLNTSLPTVTIDPPTGAAGTQIVVDPVLALCPNQTLGVACDGITTNTVENMAVGDSAIFCMMTEPTYGSQYSASAEGCCYNCKRITFTNTGSDVTNVYYVDCTSHNIAFITLTQSGDPDDHNHVPICCVNNSWYWDPSASPITVTDGGSC